MKRKPRYTGYKDINGNKIHEGDVVDFTFFYYAETEIEDCKKGTIMYKKGRPVFYTGYEYFLDDLNFDSESDIEIVGHLYF